MKKYFLLFIISLLCTLDVFAQGFSDEKFEKYVGFARGKYPLTVAGLQRAVNSLPSDSGVVWVAYPGIDTTGLGFIPTNVQLRGWISGIEIGSSFNPVWGTITGSLSSQNDLQVINDSLASDIATLVIVDDSLASDIAASTVIQDSLVSDIATLVVVDDSLASDITNLVDKTTTQTITGEKTFSNSKTVFSGDSVGIRGDLDVDGGVNVGTLGNSIFTEIDAEITAPNIIEGSKLGYSGVFSVVNGYDGISHTTGTPSYYMQGSETIIAVVNDTMPSGIASNIGIWLDDTSNSKVTDGWLVNNPAWVGYSSRFKLGDLPEERGAGRFVGYSGYIDENSLDDTDSVGYDIYGYTFRSGLGTDRRWTGN